MKVKPNEMNDELMTLTVWRKLWYEYDPFGDFLELYGSSGKILAFTFTFLIKICSNWFIAAIRICEHVLLKRDSMRKLSLVRGRRISEANRGMTRSGRWWGFQVESLLKVGRRRVPLFIHPIQSLQDVPEMLNYLSPNLELYVNLRQGGVCVSI